MRRSLAAFVFLLATYVAASYDVIVVGSGPGGLVAAELLSRDAAVSVLVLEAGGASVAATGGTDVPAYAAASGLTKFDIPGEYTSVAFQPSSAYRPEWIASPKTYVGKVVGGSSSLNGMLYFRPPDAYVAASSWPNSVADVASGFAAIESLFSVTDTPSPDGKRYFQEGYSILAAALERHGQYKETRDINATRNAKTKTYGHPPFAIQDGLRASPAKTFYGAMKARPNFQLVTGATVAHVVHAAGLATAVVYTTSGGVHITAQLSPRGVVLMAAGALSTPKVLIQSNIGPKVQLELIESAPHLVRDAVVQPATSWVINENVGQHVFDTQSVMLTVENPTMVAYVYGAPSARDTALYVARHAGPYASPDPILIGYDSILVKGHVYEGQVTGFCHGFSGPTSSHVGLAVYLNNPQSRDACGFTADGSWHGDLNHSLYLSHSDDVAALGTLVQKIVNLLGSDSTLVQPPSSANVEVWAAAHVGGTNHFGGSCYASGDAADTCRCSDERLRVVGTKNVYVGDASAMKEGTVNPYGWVMYTGYQAARNIQRAWAGETAVGNTNSSPTIGPGTASTSSANCNVADMLAVVCVIVVGVVWLS